MISIAAKEVLLRMLESQGVKYVFGNPGTTEIPFLDALSRYPSIEYVLALNEGVAVSMADGYARVSRTPAIVSVHSAPGVANGMGMLFNAWRDRVPLILLAGQMPSRFLLRQPMLSADQVRLTEQFTMWSYEIRRPEELPLALERAFKVSMQSPGGPVFLSLPRDLLEEAVQVSEPFSQATNATYRPRGDKSDVERAAKLLLQAHSPIVLAGAGVEMSMATQELTALAESCALRVFAPPGLLPWDHPMLCGSWRPIRQELTGCLDQADLLLVVGAPMFREYTPLEPAPELPTIHIDPDPWEVGKNYPSTLGIVADPKTALQDLSQAVESLIRDDQRLALRERFGLIEASNRNVRASRAKELEKVWESVPISPVRLIAELGQALDQDALIVNEATISGTYFKSFYPFGQSGHYMGCEAGCLGWGLGAALGAKLARPEKKVVAFLGDGSTAFSLQALWTAARYKVPVPVIVCNNGTYMAVKSNLFAYREQDGPSGDYRCTELGGIDFVAMAGSLGVEARRVDRPQDLHSSLEWSLMQDRPTLLEVAVDPQDAGYGRHRIR